MAIPDGILRIGGTLVVIEVKLSHTERAWWQLNRLYAPLLRQLVIPSVSLRCVEICRHYDPDAQFPSPSRLVDSLHRIPDGVTGILQWKL